MKPVLFTLGNQPISSFGVFSLLSLSVVVFTIWRIVKVYELDEEKTLDLMLLILLGGFIGARLYFILFNLPQFDSLTKIFLINKYPGLSFWGSFIGGLFTLRLFAKRLKFNFWQIADFAIVGVFVGLSISSIGCLLSSCQYGLETTGGLAVTQVGLLGKRFPIQIIEGIVFLLLFLNFYKSALKFHFSGQILARGLIYLGVVKLLLEFFYGDRLYILANFSLGTVWSISLIILGIWVYYHQSKRSLVKDLQFLYSLSFNSKARKLVVLSLKKSCYNLGINFRIGLFRFLKRLRRLMNVRPNPQNF